MSRAQAAAQGREYVTPDDVKILAEATLSHRIIVSHAARVRGSSGAEIVREIERAIPVPGANPRVTPVKV